MWEIWVLHSIHWLLLTNKLKPASSSCLHTGNTWYLGSDCGIPINKVGLFAGTSMIAAALLVLIGGLSTHLLVYKRKEKRWDHWVKRSMIQSGLALYKTTIIYHWYDTSKFLTFFVTSTKSLLWSLLKPFAKQSSHCGTVFIIVIIWIRI